MSGIARAIRESAYDAERFIVENFPRDEKGLLILVTAIFSGVVADQFVADPFDEALGARVAAVVSAAGIGIGTLINAQRPLDRRTIAVNL